MAIEISTIGPLIERWHAERNAKLNFLRRTPLRQHFVFQSNIISIGDDLGYASRLEGKCKRLKVSLSKLVKL